MITLRFIAGATVAALGGLLLIGLYGVPSRPQPAAALIFATVAAASCVWLGVDALLQVYAHLIARRSSTGRA